MPTPQSQKPTSSSASPWLASISLAAAILSLLSVNWAASASNFSSLTCYADSIGACPEEQHLCFLRRMHVSMVYDLSCCLVQASFGKSIVNPGPVLLIAIFVFFTFALILIVSFYVNSWSWAGQLQLNLHYRLRERCSMR